MIVTNEKGGLWKVDAKSIDDRGRFSGVGAYLVIDRRQNKYTIELLEHGRNATIIGRARVIGGSR